MQSINTLPGRLVIPSLLLSAQTCHPVGLPWQTEDATLQGQAPLVSAPLSQGRLRQLSATSVTQYPRQLDEYWAAPPNATDAELR
jgi:hypothetical protein